MLTAPQASNQMTGGRDKRAIQMALEGLVGNDTILKDVVTNLVADVTALATALDVLATKLNADAGVTDTNYSKVNAAAVTAEEPGDFEITL